MSNGFFARAVVVSLLGLVGMSLGCDKLPSGPSPSAAPIVTAASPNPALTATTISPRVGLIGEEVWIAGTGFVSGATLTLDGVAARVTGVNSGGATPGTRIVAITPVHAAGPVDVVVTNPGGQSGTVTGGYTFVPALEVFLTASPNLVTSGSKLTMSWVAPSGRGCNGGGDYIALYRVGDPDNTGAANGHSDLWYEHLCGATSGTFTLSAPPQPGQYEFRYLVGNIGGVARSNAVTVSASPSP
jgi:IPT/TIG domain-containing protein